METEKTPEEIHEEQVIDGQTKTINGRFIKIYGELECPVILSAEKRYYVAMELSVEGDEGKHKKDGTWDLTYKCYPVGAAVIKNPEGKQMRIKVKSTPSQELRFHLQTLWEDRKLEGTIEFETWYKNFYKKLYGHIDRILSET